MITEYDLQEAIAECEGQRNPTANTCLKLAAFYIIQDKKFPKNEPNFYSTKSSFEAEKIMDERVEHTENESEFRQAAVGMSTSKLIEIMDEVMETIKIISPKLYDGVMRKMTSEV